MLDTAQAHSSGDMMAITATDIAFYRRLDGDLDGLIRSAERDSTVSESAWRLLDDMRQRAVIVERGSGSEAFRRELEADLAASLADAQAHSEFRRIVAADMARITGSETS